MVKKRKKGFYSISAVAEMFSVHQQTIRLMKKKDLLIQNDQKVTLAFSPKRMLIN